MLKISTAEAVKEDLGILRDTYIIVKARVEAGFKRLQEVSAFIDYLDREVNDLREVAGDESMVVRAKHTKEGNLLRTWIWTFPEVQKMVDNREEHIEEILEYWKGGGIVGEGTQVWEELAMDRLAACI